VKERQRRHLESLVRTPIEWSCPLSRHTSFAIGGPAEALVRLVNVVELQQVLRFFTEENLHWRVIGKGTNLLVADSGYAGAVLRLEGELATVTETPHGEDAVLVTAGGGAGFSRLCRSTCDHGLTGLEFGCGIPGSVGGALCMNAGAWGEEIGPVVSAIRLVGGDGEKEVAPQPVDFTYRAWTGCDEYKGRAVIVAVDLVLRHGDREAILGRVRQLAERRKDGQPNDYANAGSFFKNPPGDSAGRLIELCGLKGYRVGAAMVSEKHANFLVNTGHARAADVLRLMRLIQDRVREKTGVALQPEVHFLGEDLCG
jgi:UDP-N-acetylmuramate dehydrogenase